MRSNNKLSRSKALQRKHGCRAEPPHTVNVDDVELPVIPEEPPAQAQRDSPTTAVSTEQTSEERLDERYERKLNKRYLLSSKPTARWSTRVGAVAGISEYEGGIRSRPLLPDRGPHARDRRATKACPEAIDHPQDLESPMLGSLCGTNRGSANWSGLHTRIGHVVRAHGSDGASRGSAEEAN